MNKSLFFKGLAKIIAGVSLVAIWPIGFGTSIGYGFNFRNKINENYNEIRNNEDFIEFRDNALKIINKEFETGSISYEEYSNKTNYLESTDYLTNYAKTYLKDVYYSLQDNIKSENVCLGLCVTSSVGTAAALSGTILILDNPNINNIFSSGKDDIKQSLYDDKNKKTDKSSTMEH